MYFSNWGLHFGQIDRNSKIASKVPHLPIFLWHATRVYVYLHWGKLTEKKISLTSQKIGIFDKTKNNYIYIHIYIYIYQKKANAENIMQNMFCSFCPMSHVVWATMIGNECFYIYFYIYIYIYIFFFRKDMPLFLENLILQNVNRIFSEKAPYDWYLNICQINP